MGIRSDLLDISTAKLLVILAKLNIMPDECKAKAIMISGHVDMVNYYRHIELERRKGAYQTAYEDE